MKFMHDQHVEEKELEIIDSISEIISKFVSDKVSYYWETGTGCSPAMEVFLEGNDEEVKEKMEEAERKIRDFNITSSQATVDREHMRHLDDDTNVHRIVVYMNVDKMEISDILSIANILSQFGSNELPA